MPTIHFKTEAQLRRAIINRGYEIFSRIDINDGCQFACSDSLIATYYHESGSALCQGKGGHVGYAKLSNASEPAAGYVVFVLPEQKREKDAASLQELLRTNGISPVSFRVGIDDVYEGIEAYRDVVQAAVILCDSNGLAASEDIQLAAHDMSVLLGASRVHVLCNGAIPEETLVSDSVRVKKYDRRNRQTVFTEISDRLYTAADDYSRKLIKNARSK